MKDDRLVMEALRFKNLSLATGASKFTRQSRHQAVGRRSGCGGTRCSVLLSEATCANTALLPQYLLIFWLSWTIQNQKNPKSSLMMRQAELSTLTIDLLVPAFPGTEGSCVQLSRAFDAGCATPMERSTLGGHFLCLEDRSKTPWTPCSRV